MRSGAVSPNSPQTIAYGSADRCVTDRRRPQLIGWVLSAKEFNGCMRKEGPTYSERLIARCCVRSLLSNWPTGRPILLISELDGAAAGYLLAEISARPTNPFRHASNSLYVHHIAVGPALQRRRIGKELMDAALAIGRAENVDAIRLDSWSFNTSAHGFFESDGFTPLNVVFERKLL